MSFSSSVKQELMGLSMKTSCCRRSLLYGAMIGAHCESSEILFSTEIEEVASYISKLIREFFGKETTMDYKVYVGRPKYSLRFESSRAYRFLHMVDTGEALASDKRCPNCPQAFLRGAFLAVGTVNDPSHSYHAEFVLSSATRAEYLDVLLAELDIPARRIVRGKKIGLYYKNSSSIEELFAEMGGSRVVFDLVNAKIEREIRNNENRATNCDAKNIARTVDASQKQIAAIIRLMDCGMLDSLDDELRKTALLRMKHDEASLSELAALHEPPISKSGLNHRLSKLFELSEKIK